MSDELDVKTTAELELVQLAMYAKILQEEQKPKDEKVCAVTYVTKLAIQAGIFAGE